MKNDSFSTQEIDKDDSSYIPSATTSDTETDVPTIKPRKNTNNKETNL